MSDVLNQYIVTKNLNFVSRFKRKRDIVFSFECKICFYSFNVKAHKLKTHNGCAKCNTKKTSQNIIKEFYCARNFELLEDPKAGMSAKYKTICNTCDFIWYSIPSCIKKGAGCSNCAGNAKLTSLQIEHFFTSKKLKIIGNINENSKTKQSVECLDCNFKYEVSYSSLIKTQSCKQCKRTNQVLYNKYTRDEAITLYNTRGLQLIDDNYTNYHHKHQTQCLQCKSIVYVALSSPAKIACSNCRKPTDLKLKDIYLKNNFKLIGKYKKAKDDLECECITCNAINSISYRNIIRNPRCWKCTNKIRNFEDFYNLFLTNNFLLLDTEYKTSKHKYNVKCLSCDETLQLAHDHVRQGVGCFKCNRHLNEKITGNFLRELLPHIDIQAHYMIRTPEFAYKNKIYVDYRLTVNNTDIIIEYNGDQHYRFVDFGQGTLQAKKDFEIQQKRDEYLRLYCSSNNIILFEIDGRKIKGDDIKIYIQNILYIYNLDV